MKPRASSNPSTRRMVWARCRHARLGSEHAAPLVTAEASVGRRTDGHPRLRYLQGALPDPSGARDASAERALASVERRGHRRAATEGRAPLDDYGTAGTGFFPVKAPT